MQKGFPKLLKLWRKDKILFFFHENIISSH